jgi:hypothetical protein
VTSDVEARMRGEVTKAMYEAHADPSLQAETDIVYGHPVEALLGESANATDPFGSAADPHGPEPLPHPDLP